MTDRNRNISIETPPLDPGRGTAAGTGVVAAECGIGALRQTVLTLSSVSITMTDAVAAGCHGSQKVYDFPAGLIHVMGVVCDLTTLAGTGGITDTSAVVGSVGTVAAATDNATLTTTEANLAPSFAGTLAAGAGTMKSLSTAALMAAAVIDGTVTAVDAFLNFATVDAGSTANDTLTVSGTITITWINYGDV